MYILELGAGAGGRVLPGYLLSSGQASGAVGGLVVGGGGQVTIGPLYSSGLADSRDTISASKSSIRRFVITANEAARPL